MTRESRIKLNCRSLTLSRETGMNDRRTSARKEKAERHTSIVYYYTVMFREHTLTDERNER